MSVQNILAEALLRIEHKLDILVNALIGAPKTPMHFVGQQCPVCKNFIDYTVDVQHQVVVRRCGCKSGKVPSTIPLVPTGAPVNGNPSSAEAEPGPGTEEGDWSKGR